MTTLENWKPGADRLKSVVMRQVSIRVRQSLVLAVYHAPLTSNVVWRRDDAEMASIRVRVNPL